MHIQMFTARRASLWVLYPFLPVIAAFWTFFSFHFCFLLNDKAYRQLLIHSLLCGTNMVYLKREQIAALIYAQLHNNGELGYNELFAKIHEYQEANPKKYRGKLSRRIFNKYLKAMHEQEIVKTIGKKYALAEDDKIRRQWAFNELVLATANFLSLIPIDVDHELITEDLASETIGEVNRVLKNMNKNDIVRIREVAEYLLKSIDRYQMTEGQK